MAERLGSQAINQKVAGSIPAVSNNVVSLGKALHPTCLGENVPVSLWIRASAKCKCNIPSLKIIFGHSAEGPLPPWELNSA